MVLKAFVVSRLLILAAIYVAPTILEPGTGGYADAFGTLTRWDGSWYLGIVNDGYNFTPGKHSNIGFFPGYPLLVKIASALIPNTAVAALVVSNVAFLIAALLLNALIRREYVDDNVSRAAIALLMFSPVSFFFSAAYTESTFLALSLGAFTAALNRQWLVAGLCGMLLAATRNIGVLISIPLLLEFIRQAGTGPDRWRNLVQPRILLLGLVPAGFFLFLLFGYMKFGDPFVYMRATALWNRTASAPWVTIINSAYFAPFYQVLFGLVLVSGFALWAAAIRFRLRTSYVVWAGILLTIYICGNNLEAIPRYLSVVFPLFIAFGLLTQRIKWTFEIVFGLSVALLTICTILSAAGYWMT